jgi:carboxypeptidase family protein
MHARVVSLLLVVVALSSAAPAHAFPQAVELAARGPRFLAAWAPAGAVVDASKSAVLRRRVSLELTAVSPREALKKITRQADLEIAYNSALLSDAPPVSLHAREITVAAALTEILLDAKVDVTVSRDGQLTVVRRRPSPAAAADSGDVVGSVRDSASGAPLASATVEVEATKLSVLTDGEGRYRIAGVPAGPHMIKARYIGYAPAVSSVEVVPGQEVRVDLSLGKTVHSPHFRTLSCPTCTPPPASGTAPRRARPGPPAPRGFPAPPSCRPEAPGSCPPFAPSRTGGK